MGFWEFIASIIDSLAWPTVVFCGVYFFRGQVGQLINRIISAKKTKDGFAFDFSEATKVFENKSTLAILKVTPENLDWNAWINSVQALEISLNTLLRAILLAMPEDKSEDKTVSSGNFKGVLRTVEAFRNYYRIHGITENGVDKKDFEKTKRLGVEAGLIEG